jgi:hypothetical protein
MNNEHEVVDTGGPAEFMTLRDFYAAFIALGIISRPDVQVESEVEFAETVYKLVDALIFVGEGGNDYKH